MTTSMAEALAMLVPSAPATSETQALKFGTVSPDGLSVRVDGDTAALPAAVPTIGQLVPGSRVVILHMGLTMVILGTLGTVDSTPPGIVSAYAGTVAPTGWLLCDGTLYSRTTYPRLFSAIGTTYGGASTTFGVPNIKGATVVGVDSSQSEFNTIGKTGGAKTHTLTVAQIPSHNHTITSMFYDSAKYAPLGSYLSGDVHSSKTLTTDSTGGGGSHNNLQPYIAMNYIIHI